MIDTRVVVADGSHARFFSTDAEMLELVPDGELDNHHHAGSHRRRVDEGPAHHAEEAAFAKDLAQVIARAVDAHEIRDVVLVAPARFRGELERALPGSAARHVTGRVDHDFTKVERHELARRIRDALA